MTGVISQRAVTDNHRFEQDTRTWVLACVCGKWPEHHVHTGRRDTCACDLCSFEQGGGTSD